MKKITMNLSIFGIVVAIIICLSSYDSKQRKLEKQIKLSQELSTLREISDAVYEKFVPDSLKEKEQTAYHDLMYVENGSEGYWQDMGQSREVTEFLENCKPFVYVQKLIKEKQEEITEK